MIQDYKKELFPKQVTLIAIVLVSCWFPVGFLLVSHWIPIGFLIFMPNGDFSTIVFAPEFKM